MHTLSSLLFTFIGVTRLVYGQDCDSFLCLRVFHQDLTFSNSTRNNLCSAAQTYIYCLRKSTQICTTLTIQDMTEVATLLMSHTVCNSASVTTVTTVTVSCLPIPLFFIFLKLIFHWSINWT